MCESLLWRHLGTTPEEANDLKYFLFSLISLLLVRSCCAMANLFRFYFDFLSPLSRPFCILFEHAKIRCEMVPVALRKGKMSSS
jgi:hypothetical protein